MAELRHHRRPLLAALTLIILLLGCDMTFSQEPPVMRLPPSGAAGDGTEPEPDPTPQAATEGISVLRGERPGLDMSAFLAPRDESRPYATYFEYSNHSVATYSMTPFRLTVDQVTRGGGSSQTANIPLTTHEKLKYGVRSAVLSPSGHLLTAVGAAITEATERDQPQKTEGDRVADGLSRFAIRFGTRSTKAMLGSGLYPVIFHQDPRYKPSPKRGLRSRVLYAASRVFVTENDKGEPEVNYSRLGGALSASALANIWERSTPGRDRVGVGPTLRRFGTSIGFDVVQFIIIKELWPDLKRKLFRR